MAPDATSWADLREVLAHLGGLQAAQDVQALTNAVYSMPLAMLVDVVMFQLHGLARRQSGSTVSQHSNAAPCEAQEAQARHD